MLFLLWILPIILGVFELSNCNPLLRKRVDMTYTFDETSHHRPIVRNFEMKVVMNGTTEEGYWLQLDEYSSSTHVGTHIDAPCLFHKGKWCADEIPIERLDGPAAVVDITAKAEVNADATVDIDDLKEWESISGSSLDGTIVVMRSGWGKRWKNKEAYFGTLDNIMDEMHFPGMSPEAARWLVDNRNIYGFMSDTLSLDQGQAKDFMTHRILLGANIYGLENVANAEEIPVVGAHIYIRPMKIGKGSAAPARVVARYF